MHPKYIILLAENIEFVSDGHSQGTLDDIKKMAKDLSEQNPDKEFCIFQYLGSYKQQTVWTPFSPELVDRGDGALVPKSYKPLGSFSYINGEVTADMKPLKNFYIDENAEKVVDGLVTRKLADAETKPLKKTED